MSRVQEELIALRDSNGIIDAKRVVDWARQHQDSALYQSLEWDNALAAEEYRFHQVRRLVAIHIVDADGHRAAVSLSIDRTKGGGYRMLDDVMKVDDLRSVALSDALAELDRIQEKYRWLTELAKVWKAKAEAERNTQSKRRRRAA